MTRNYKDNFAFMSDAIIMHIYIYIAIENKIIHNYIVDPSFI